MKRIFCSLILWGVVALMSVAAPKLKTLSSLPWWVN